MMNTATAAMNLPTVEREIVDAYVGFDDSALLLYSPKASREANIDRQRRFFCLVETAARRYNRRTWISADAIQALQHHTGDSDPARAEAASNALTFIARMREADLMQMVDHLGVAGYISSAAEILIICRTMRGRSRERLSVFTQHADLARSLMAINEEACVVPEQRISAYRVTGVGTLGAFLPSFTPVKQPESRWTEQGYEVLLNPAPMTQAARGRFGPDAVAQGAAPVYPFRAAAQAPQAARRPAISQQDWYLQTGC